MNNRQTQEEEEKILDCPMFITSKNVIGNKQNFEKRGQVFIFFGMRNVMHQIYFVCPVGLWDIDATKKSIRQKLFQKTGLWQSLVFVNFDVKLWLSNTK